jgi:hypothetical protein
MLERGYSIKMGCMAKVRRAMGSNEKSQGNFGKVG